jgi:isoamylase
MLSHGDELGRTQRGNNNAYAQDNEISWVDRTTRRDRRASGWPAALLPRLEEGNKDVTWIAPGGGEMTTADWRDAAGHAIGMLIDGNATDETDARGRPVQGDTMLLLLNGGPHPVHFVLPAQETPGQWMRLVDTASDTQSFPALTEHAVTVEPHALVLLRYATERRTAPASIAAWARAGTELAEVGEST